MKAGIGPTNPWEATHREKLRREAGRLRERAASIEDLARFWPLADWSRRRYLEEAGARERELRRRRG